jgi:hypothetical protein
MSAVTIQQMADRVASLLEERLNAGGGSFADKLRKAGRQLPRRVREAAEVLAQAGIAAQNPKLLRRIDEEKVAAAYDVCVRHLGGVNAGDRRRGRVLGVAASIAFSLLVVALLLLAVLRWRGFL